MQAAATSLSVVMPSPDSLIAHSTQSGERPMNRTVQQLVEAFNCTALRRTIERSTFSIAAARGIMPRFSLAGAFQAGRAGCPVPPLVIHDRRQAILPAAC